MSEPREGQIPLVAFPEQSQREDILSRKTPLTLEEISRARFDFAGENSVQRWTGKKYTFGKNSIFIRNSVSLKFGTDYQKPLEQVTDLMAIKREEESFPYEWYLVNALYEQNSIAESFGLPTDYLLNSLYLDLNPGTKLTDWTGKVWLNVLKDHIQKLKLKNASHEQLITELAGHIFHEAVHRTEKKGIDVALLNGKPEVGEITTVTAQLAYYLSKGYQGPHSYDTHRIKFGLDKLQKGLMKLDDYDIASAVGWEIVLHSLKGSYPDYESAILGMNMIDACQFIVSHLSSEQRQQLIPTLKSAIARSADEQEDRNVIKQLKDRSAA